MDLKEKLTTGEKVPPQEAVKVIKGMVDSDISQVLQVMVQEIDELQKRVGALEKK